YILQRCRRHRFSAIMKGISPRKLVGLLYILGAACALTSAQVATEGPRPTTSPSTIDLKTGRQFWAFQPIRRLDPPRVQDEQWIKNPIDRFVLGKLQERGLRPAPPATKLELVRRVYFDLTGLPPDPDQIKAFV